MYYVYILANKPYGTLYVGVTNDLLRRIAEHCASTMEGFTKKWHIHRLVYFEYGDGVEGAISREKQLKKWRRDWKIELIEKENPRWEDLYPAFVATNKV